MSPGKPTYALEHLATFKIRNDSEIANPKEKLKILFDLDRTGGISPQKMYMCFSGSWLVMLDAEMNEIENFPGSMIREPTAFISKDPMETFNNILIFTVPGSLKGNNTEMHIFQVLTVSAIYMVEDLKELCSGNIVSIDRNLFPIYSQKQESELMLMKSKLDGRRMNGATEQMNWDRDILVLNHCFEDIERFVSRLHYAAEAMKEIESNRLVQNIHLISRSRPPLESEFVDIFAKFKLGFNYITKLQNHFKDPKEPIQNMFTSLRTVVDTCNDIHESTNLVKFVVNPLLSLETINLLSSCLGRHEKEFWHSLGKNWTHPKDQFKDHKGSYHPIFHDDWSPDWAVDEEVSYLPPAMKMNTRPSSYEESYTFSPDTSCDNWLGRLQSRNVKIAEAKFARVSHSDRELNVVKGEYFEVIDDSRNWWKVRNCIGQTGYVPHTILFGYNFDQNSNYSGMDTDSLSSSIVDQAATTHDKEVHAPPVPRSISMPNVPIPPPPPPPKESTPTTPTSINKRHTMKATGTLAAMRARNDCDTEENIMVQQKINEELKHSLMMRERRKDLEILKTPQIYIEPSSSPEEVEEWLRAKGFPSDVIMKLRGLSGEQLFALPYDTIEGYFGQRESSRLISQIILQKNFSGYKTTRSAELQMKLAKARQKTGDITKTDEVF